MLLITGELVKGVMTSLEVKTTLVVECMTLVEMLATLVVEGTTLPAGLTVQAADLMTLA